MKTRFSVAILISLLSGILIVAGCGGSTAATTSTSPATTPKTSTTTAATSTTPPVSTTALAVSTTTSAGGTLPTVPVAITTHTAAVLASYKDLCMMCHAAGTTNAFPATPSWNGAANGSTVNKGTYAVAAGSPADHTGRTVGVCTTQAGCHVAPAA